MLSKVASLMQWLIIIMCTLSTAGLAADEGKLDSDLTGNVQIVKKIYESFAAGDMEASMRDMDDHIVWKHPGVNTSIPFAGTFKGHEGVRQFFSIAMKTLEVLDQRVNDFVASGDKVVALGYEHMRVIKTGKDYESNWAHVYTFKDGKVIKFEEFIDTAELAAAFDEN